MQINKESCSVADQGLFSDGIFKKKVLPDEVDGIQTHYFVCKSETSITIPAEKNRVFVFLLIDGNGTAKTGNKLFTFDEVALVVPEPNTHITMSAEFQELHFLQLILDLKNDDHQYIQYDKLPYLITYSECKQYKEAIKSEKTVNRTLLPEEIVPRLCIGSVETTGPDTVKEHSHPMLEQYFFGLQKNDCEVTADGSVSHFKEKELLHIPLGSVHGVSVDAGKKLHYIWIDLFLKREGQSYIKDHHIEIEDE